MIEREAGMDPAALLAERAIKWLLQKIMQGRCADAPVQRAMAPSWTLTA